MSKKPRAQATKVVDDQITGKDIFYAFFPEGFKFHLKLAFSEWKPVYLERDPSNQNSKLASSGWKLVHLQWESVLTQIETCIFRVKNGRFLNRSSLGWRWDHSDGYGRFLNRSRQGWRCDHCHGGISNWRWQGWRAFMLNGAAPTSSNPHRLSGLIFE